LGLRLHNNRITSIARTLEVAEKLAEMAKARAIFPTIAIDGERFEGTVTRKQIEALLSKARVI
jgi:hypothetical protein